MPELRSQKHINPQLPPSDNSYAIFRVPQSVKVLAAVVSMLACRESLLSQDVSQSKKSTTSEHIKTVELEASKFPERNNHALWLAVIAGVSVIPLAYQVFTNKTQINRSTFHVLSVNGLAASATSFAAQGVGSGFLVNLVGTFNSMLLYCGATRQKNQELVAKEQLQGKELAHKIKDSLWPEKTLLRQDELTCRRLALGALGLYVLSNIPAMSNFISPVLLNATGLLTATSVFLLGIIPQVNDLWKSNAAGDNHVSDSLGSRLSKAILGGLPWHTFTGVRFVTFIDSIENLTFKNLNSVADCISQFLFFAGNAALSFGVLRRDLKQAAEPKDK